MRLAITRLAEKGGQDNELCASFGHSCGIISPLSAEPDEEVIGAFLAAYNREEFDAVFFTSAYPAEKTAPKMQPNSCRIISIGPKTAEILERNGINSEILPEFYSKAFVPYLGEWIAGKRIGIPRAAVKNAELIAGIQNAGGIPCEYGCYALRATKEILDVCEYDAVLFTSAKSFTEAIFSDLSGKLLIAIGEVTADAMRSRGAVPAVVGDGSLAGTLAALNRYLGI